MKPEPIKQSWYEENRSLYGAETVVFDTKKLETKHTHNFKRISWSEVVCTVCNCGWIDNHSLPV